MTSNEAARSIVERAAQALAAGGRVALRIDGDAEWIRVGKVELFGNESIAAMPAGKENWLFIPCGRLVAASINDTPES